MNISGNLVKTVVSTGRIDLSNTSRYLQERDKNLVKYLLEWIWCIVWWIETHVPLNLSTTCQPESCWTLGCHYLHPRGWWTYIRLRLPPPLHLQVVFFYSFHNCSLLPRQSLLLCSFLLLAQPTFRVLSLVGIGWLLSISSKICRQHLQYWLLDVGLLDVGRLWSFLALTLVFFGDALGYSLMALEWFFAYSLATPLWLFGRIVLWSFGKLCCRSFCWCVFACLCQNHNPSSSSDSLKEKAREGMEDALRKRCMGEEVAVPNLGIEGEMLKKRKEDVGGSNHEILGFETCRHLDFEQHLDDIGFLGRDIKFDASHFTPIPQMM